jgi:hypothetical protein
LIIINFKNIKKFFLFLLFSTLILIQLEPFLNGYRLTADDIEFHYYFMSGFNASWDFIKNTSIVQGRIVHFVDLPFSILGANYADNYLFRLFYTVLYFFNFILIGIWGSLLYCNKVSKNIVLYVTLILVSFHPLDFFHLAPNAYPFHVTLPLFFILVGRIGQI